ncbi:MAG: hypothetical protein JSV09_14470 [Thermoplasmata archaeon]|nr:MAG: hypothetical protein JSV09_14470 [Thermoplasmata archaeon]
MHVDLNQKNLNIEILVKKAPLDEDTLRAITQGILSKNDTVHFNSHKVLLMLAEQHPKSLDPYWEFLEELLESKNDYQRYIAIQILANLSNSDYEHRFENLFDKYYDILSGKKTMVARQIVLCSGKIALAKPHLQSKITEKLFNIDKLHRGKQMELLKGDALEAFDEFYEEAGNKEEIIEFAKNQLNSKSTKTKKRAEKFLKKWERINPGPSLV